MLKSVLYVENDYLPLSPPCPPPPPYLHTVSDQILEVGTAWERGYLIPLPSPLLPLPLPFSPCPSPPPLPSSSLTSSMTHLPDPEALIYLVLLQAHNQGAFDGFNRTPESP